MGMPSNKMNDRKNYVMITKEDFFDCNCMIGPRLKHDGHGGDSIDAAALLSLMDRYRIGRALAYHSMAREDYISEGNNKAVEEIKNTGRIYPCWVVMPHYSGECPGPKVLISKMSLDRVCAVRIFPVYHRIKLSSWLWGELFESMASKRIPVFVDFSNTGWSQEIDWDAVHGICSAFPELRLILLRQGLIADRYIYYLLDRHKNLYVETSYYQVNNGISGLVREFGAERLIFGTGMPFYDPGCPVHALKYSGLCKEDIFKIASSNLEKLLSGVKLYD